METGIGYGMGWDPERRKFVGAMPLAGARRRDEAREPYSVMMVSGSILVGSSTGMATTWPYGCSTVSAAA